MTKGRRCQTWEELGLKLYEHRPLSFELRAGGDVGDTAVR